MSETTADRGIEPRDCTVRDGRFIVPCGALRELIDGSASFSRAKGIRRWDYFKSGVPTRSFIGVKTSRHPDGFLFNFCPCCGAKIDAPFAEDDPTPPSLMDAAGTL